MKFSLIVAAAALGAVNAHYTFDKLIVDGKETGNPWQYIRQNTRQEKYMPTKFIESFGTTPLDNDFRCNQGSFTNAGKTQVAVIAPGTKLAVKLAYGATMRHPGPMQVYMSKAPGSVVSYDGSGDWWKIYQATTCGSTADGLDDTDWCSWDKDRIEFTVPVNTPPGEYLIRPEHIGLHGAHAGQAEFYYSCIQVRVTGNGNGVPGPLVKIPGVYKKDDPSVNFSIWGRRPYDPLIPGPPVWDGSGSSKPVTTTSSIRPMTTSVRPTTTSVRPTTTPVRPTTTSVRPTTARPTMTYVLPITVLPNTTVKLVTTTRAMATPSAPTAAVPTTAKPSTHRPCKGGRRTRGRGGRRHRFGKKPFSSAT